VGLVSFNILAAVDKLCEIQLGLVIESPINKDVKAAYPGPLDMNRIPSDLPCFINTVELQPTKFSSSLLQRKYEINMQMLVKDPSLASAYRTLLAFEEQLIRALAQNVTLGGNVTNIEEIRGSVAMSVYGLPALDYYAIVAMSETQEYYA
jgi:hypothetical protein